MKEKVNFFTRYIFRGAIIPLHLAAAATAAAKEAGMDKSAAAEAARWRNREIQGHGIYFHLISSILPLSDWIRRSLSSLSCSMPITDHNGRRTRRRRTTPRPSPPPRRPLSSSLSLSFALSHSAKFRIPLWNNKRISGSLSISPNWRFLPSSLPSAHNRRRTD